MSEIITQWDEAEESTWTSQVESNSEEEKVKVSVACGCYVGTPKWRQGLDDWRYESDECPYEEEIFIRKEDWDNGFAAITCPECRMRLTQDMDHFQLVDGVVK